MHITGMPAQTPSLWGGIPPGHGLQALEGRQPRRRGVPADPHLSLRLTQLLRLARELLAHARQTHRSWRRARQVRVVAVVVAAAAADALSGPVERRERPYWRTQRRTATEATL